jgi:hypothetical protein
MRYQIGTSVRAACDGIDPSPGRRDVESLSGVPRVPKIIIFAEMASGCGDPPACSHQAGNAAEDV